MKVFACLLVLFSCCKSLVHRGVRDLVIFFAPGTTLEGLNDNYHSRSQRLPYFLNPQSGSRSALMVDSQVFFFQQPAGFLHDGNRRYFLQRSNIALPGHLSTWPNNQKRQKLMILDLGGQFPALLRIISLLTLTDHCDLQDITKAFTIEDIQIPGF